MGASPSARTTPVRFPCITAICPGSVMLLTSWSRTSNLLPSFSIILSRGSVIFSFLFHFLLKKRRTLLAAATWRAPFCTYPMARSNKDTASGGITHFHCFLGGIRITSTMTTDQLLIIPTLRQLSISGSCPHRQIANGQSDGGRHGISK